MSLLEKANFSSDEIWFLNLILKGHPSYVVKGVPLGNQSSQWFALYYLNTIDRLVKEKLRIKYYLRYMDDFIFVENSKKRLREILADTIWFMDTQLRLKLNPKTKIFPISRGVDFAGYRTFTNKILPRKRNIKAARIRFKKLSNQYRHGRIRIEDIRPKVASFIGYTKHCNARKTTQSTMKYLLLKRGE